MNSTYVYIEDSGNLFNTKILVIVFVIFNNVEDVIATSKCIQSLIDMKIKGQNKELHFNKESSSMKKSFFKQIKSQKFFIQYYMANNLNKVLNFEEHLILGILENRDKFQGSKIFVDGNKTLNKNPILLYKIKKILKDQKILIKSIHFEDSKSNNLIQLADMCAGCIRKNFERGTSLDKELFKLIKKFIS